MSTHPEPPAPATVVITMAGRGQRFRDAGHDGPKHEIVVRGRSLFAWSLDSVRSWTRGGAHVVFLTRAEDDATAFVAAESAALGLASWELVELEATTDGQATTALLAGAAVRDPELPLVIYNIDTHVRPCAMRAQDAGGDGWIPCFPGAGDHWSFVRDDGRGRALEVREKRRISAHATVGLYWFGSYRLYAELYARHFAGGAGAEAGERYVAPMYSTLIAEGGDVRLGVLEGEDVVALGTPAEVRRFEAATGSA